MRIRRALVVMAALGAACAPWEAAVAGSVELKASYAITLAIFTIGEADVAGHFTDQSYSASITGATTGLGVLVSNSHAEMSGSGSISANAVSPARFAMHTAENGFETRVDMTIRNGALANVNADPQLIDAPDRVPLTPANLAHVFDPIGALIVTHPDTDTPDGKDICTRTIPVFDGWVRYDIVLSFKGTTTVPGTGSAYSGPAVICQARYVPVAGHRLSLAASNYMAQNQRLEAWLVPIRGTNLMVPYKFIVGTLVGDLSVTARDFVVTSAAQ